MQGTFNINDAMIIAPSDPERSVLYYRISSLGGARMPRVGSRVVDQQAVDLIHDWIAKIPDAKESAALKAEREETEALVATLRDADPSKAAASKRSEVIRRLTASTSRALALSRALAHSAVSAVARAEVLAAVKDHAATEVRDLFERFIPESERVKRLGDSIDPKEILTLNGDAGRGRSIFVAESIVNCKSCHRIGGVGVEVGPDLSKIGAKYPRPELLRQILQPSATIDPKYSVYQIETRSGTVHSGLLARRDDKEVVIRDAQNKEVRIPADEIEQLSPSKQSLMPELLLKSLTAQQAADLLEYLTSLK
jgi:putative heme-binding domain-containing protein